jgi:hypothetical protein
MVTAKDKPTENPTGLPADADAPGNAEMQKTVDKAEEQGFYGVETDPTPNSHYSVDGVTSGAPTPETDAKHADEVAKHVRDLAGPGNGPGPR